MSNYAYIIAVCNNVYKLFPVFHDSTKKYNLVTCRSGPGVGRHVPQRWQQIKGAGEGRILVIMLCHNIKNQNLILKNDNIT